MRKSAFRLTLFSCSHLDNLSIYIDRLCVSHLCSQSLPIGTIPQTISLVGLSIGNHNFTVNAPINSSQILQATVRFPSKLILWCVIYRTVPIVLNLIFSNLSDNPTLVCATSTKNTQLSITCAPNFNTTEGTCTCLLDDNPFEPCKCFSVQQTTCIMTKQNIINLYRNPP